MFENRKIWIPDTFVVGSSKGYVNEGPSRSFLRLKADGSVASSFRYIFLGGRGGTVVQIEFFLQFLNHI